MGRNSGQSVDMFRFLVLSVATVSTASARRSANADAIEELLKSPSGTLFSDNVAEDALLDAPGLIAKYGYPSEVHHVETSDGYILELHRIPHGRGAPRRGRRPVVLIVHGLLSSSADFLILGPGKALAYILADAGYDVWLGNARGNYYSRSHTTLNPDDVIEKGFWRFSWDQIGNYDLPAFTDYILANTYREKLHYVGHSQGGTAFLVLNSLRPEYNNKFITFQGLAPASFFDNNENNLFTKLAEYEGVLEKLAFAAGYAEIGNRDFLTQHCVDSSIFNDLCQGLINLYNSREYYNRSMLPAIMGHLPAGASIRQMAHYGQVIKYNAFRRYNYNAVQNLMMYRSIAPPAYDLSLVTVPTYLHYGMSDREVNYRDVLKLASTLPNVVAVYKAERDTFNHFDFLWAIDVKELIYDDVLASMKDADYRIL